MTNCSYDFSGASVLVTGGGSGIGRAIAAAFAHADADVVITGRRSHVLEQVVHDLSPRSISAVVADVSTPDGVDTAVEAVLGRHGRVDVVVSNAATYVGGAITEVTDDDWARQQATNVDGLFFLARRTLPLLADTQGSLIASSSVSGLRGDWGQSAYNATKGAVSMFVRSLALDWGARGVRVNAVAPALTRTPMVADVVNDADLLAKAENRIALGRISEPDDIAPVVLFLASDAARFVTGVVLPVDGGTSASTGQAHF
jgi:meso-butanediol dehydrogenase/(S,S)-butanediol dehydrogenase/diacetyl reductase